jgi:DNA gyrase/topoisomerase IV subunit A
VSKVKDVPLNVQARRDYYIYGTSTIEDRAIVGPDGLKPVMRRALWAIKELGANHRAKTIKGAKMVGETLGNYHPHGDKSVYPITVPIMVATLHHRYMPVIQFPWQPCSCNVLPTSHNKTINDPVSYNPTPCDVGI